jgi:hypothetical protein
VPLENFSTIIPASVELLTKGVCVHNTFGPNVTRVDTMTPTPIMATCRSMIVLSPNFRVDGVMMYGEDSMNRGTFGD